MDTEAILQQISKLSKKERDRWSANVSNQIKRKRMSRDEAIQVVAYRKGIVTDTPSDHPKKAVANSDDPIPSVHTTVANKATSREAEPNTQSIDFTAANSFSRATTTFQHFAQIGHFVLSGLLYLVLSGSLVYQSSKAFDFSKEGIFYSFVTEGLATWFLCVHVVTKRNRWIIRSTGALSLLVGFASIIFGVKKSEELKILSNQISETSSENIQSLISLKSSEIKLLQTNLALLTQYGNRKKVISEIEEKNKQLEALFLKQNESLKSKSGISSNSARNLSWIESLQRLVSLLSALIAGHAANHAFRVLTRPRSGPDPPGPGV